MKKEQEMVSIAGNLAKELQEIRKLETEMNNMEDVASITAGCTGLFSVICCP